MKKSFIGAVVAATFSCFSYASERDTLVLLYDALSGDQWDNADGWLSEAPLYEWHGVVTRDGRVIKIELPDNNLVGQLPDGLEDLGELEVFDLRWNNIWGSIPESFGEIASLESLLLTGNELSGEIPWSIGSLQTLKRLDLSNNQLWGNIPDTLGDLRSLESLGLHHNQLTGPVPQELTQIGTLRRVILSNNTLTGTVPSGFGQLSSGVHVRIDNNPMRFDNFAGLDSLSLEERDLSTAWQVDGLDMLNETTLVIEDIEGANFVREVMSAMFVHDGYLHIESAKLSQDVSVEQLEEVINTVNYDLRKTGDRIHSIDDLERVFELYEGPRLNLPDAGADSNFSFGVGSNGANSDTNQGTILGTSQRGGSVSLKQNIETIIAAEIDCPNTKANNAHVSETDSTEIVGKGQVNCTYIFGPTQTLTFERIAYLQKWTYLGWWVYWRRVGTLGYAKEIGTFVSPGYSMSISQNRRKVATTPCVNGIYRTRLALYIEGSVVGDFSPHPGLYASAPTRLTC